MKKFIILYICLLFVQFNSPMKVLVVSVKTFPPVQGTAVLNHITGLLDWNCDIKIYSKSMPTIINTHQDIAKYDLMKLAIYKNIPVDIDTYDIILAEYGTRGAEFVEHKKGKNKLVTCFRGADLGEQLKKNPTRYQELFAKGDLFLPVCEAFKKKLIHYGCPEEKIQVLHSGIDCEQFYYKEKKIIPNEPIKLISVNRLVDKKGIPYAIQAVANLVKKGFNIQYTIVGDGPRRNEWIRMVQDLKMENIIIFKGRKQMEEVVKILHQSHIFILPSIEAESGDEEGIPNAAKEAMACGLPVVLTYHSGNEELVEHLVSGLLVKQKSIEELEEALVYLINNKNVWKKLCKAARRKIEKEFEKNSLNKDLVYLLNGLINQNVSG